jgi:3-phenylpropionate/cinnamic acid dioxygenase small subunit
VIGQAQLRGEVEDFLYTEAELLDERQFSTWVELFTEDATYTMPIRRNVAYQSWADENTRAGRDICWFDEDKHTLRKRVQQLNTGVHWAEEPVSRVCHMVSNVRITAVDGDDVRVSSCFLVYRNRLDDETDVFAGRRHDVLRQIDGQWRIAAREILLDQSVLLAKNLTLFF